MMTMRTGPAMLKTAEYARQNQPTLFFLHNQGATPSGPAV